MIRALVLAAALLSCDPDLERTECETRADCADLGPRAACSPEKWCVLGDPQPPPDAGPDTEGEP